MFRDCMPDCSLELCKHVHSLWRDESGIILNDIARGVLWKSYNKANKIRYLVIIPQEDEYISAHEQELFAQRISADYKIFPHLLHMGPLFSLQTPEIVHFALQWLCQEN